MAKSDLLNALHVLSQTHAMRASIDEMSDAELLEANAALRHVAAQLEARNNAMRAVLLARAEARGTPTDKGGTVLECHAHKAVRERRRGEYNLAEVQVLAERYALTDVIEQHVTTRVNVARLDAAARTVGIPLSELDRVGSHTYALKIEPSPELQQALSAAFPDVPDYDTNKSRKMRRPT